MDSNKIKGFFYSGNSVSGEPDYRFAEFLVSSAEVLANDIYMRVAIISIILFVPHFIGAQNPKIEQIDTIISVCDTISQPERWTKAY